MKFLTKMKDGGPDSSVTGYWLIEAKSLFSICLLKFEGKSREAFHTHAFHAISWLLKGHLVENWKFRPPFKMGFIRHYNPSIVPIITPRQRMHKVDSDGTSWVLTFRGPWSKEWKEYLPNTNEHVTLTQGREVVKNRT